MRNCDVCGSLDAGENWVLRIRNKKDSMEFKGHKSCIDDLQDRYNNIKGVSKLSLKQVREELGL